LIVLIKKMIDMQQIFSVKYEQILVEAILDGLENRFLHVFKVLSEFSFKELRIARGKALVSRKEGWREISVIESLM